MEEVSFQEAIKIAKDELKKIQIEQFIIHFNLSISSLPNNFAYEIQKYANYETDLSYSDRDFSYAVYFLCPAHQGK